MTNSITARVAGISRLRFDTDGPGIRTLVALSGCQLDCAYCINSRFRNPSFGEEYSPEKLLEQVRIDNIYFMASGGGITFGGGEPLLHSEFIRRFREICPAGWTIAVETSLNVPQEDVEQLIGIVDRWIVDIKELDPAKYLEYTGESNERVTSNLTLLEERGCASRILVRVPKILGLNSHKDIMRSSRQFRARGFETEVFDYIIPDSFKKQYSDEEALMGDVIDSEEVESEGCREGAFCSHKAIKNIYEIALKRAKDRGRARPTICVKDFEANVKPGVSDSMITGQVHREFVTAIRKTTKFTIVSISAREDMSDTFRAEVDTGAKAENPQHWGEYDSVDFYIKGSIAREGSAKRPLFFVNFEMIDYVNGTTIWNDTIRILK